MRHAPRGASGGLAGALFKSQNQKKTTQSELTFNRLTHKNNDTPVKCLSHIMFLYTEPECTSYSIQFNNRNIKTTIMITY